MKSTQKKTARRNKIRRRIRYNLEGTTERPRISVFKSNKHIYAQLIDDEKGVTVASASTVDKELRDEVAGKTGTEQASFVGKKLGERAKEKGVDQAVFDRSGYAYHGRVKAVSEGVREAGLDL